jgi:group II intron reverse transcriptase/maturase
MYVAPRSDLDWLRSEQRKLYTRSEKDLDYVFRKLWGLVTDPRNLRSAFARVARNKGARTSGVDGMTVGKVLSHGGDVFLSELRGELRSGQYRPSPVRRVQIPKRGQPGKFRPLGIPTVKDRVVQAAMKNILEPIFEADFFPVSYGFRPGKSVHGALTHLRLLLRPNELSSKDDRRLPYQWAVEGDIKGCFDHINHHALMEQVRRRVQDPKVNRLVVAFLKAGVLAQLEYQRTDEGTPQGGILSPLLANIALGVIENRYARHIWPRRLPAGRVNSQTPLGRAERARNYDRRHGCMVLFPIRYADDFIILVGAPLGANEAERAEAAKQRAEQEKAELAAYLKDALGLELSEAKTLVTPVTRAMCFLGHQVRVRRHPVHGRLVSTSVIPRDSSHQLRERIKALFRHGTVASSLAERLRLLNPLLRGWGNFYRYAWGAKMVFDSLDWYVWHTILRWLRKKHHRVPLRQLFRRYGQRSPRGRSVTWRDGNAIPYRVAAIPVRPFRLAQQRPPHYAMPRGEPGA